MTTDIDRVLARARLRPTAPYAQADIDAAEQRLAARVAARHRVPAPDGPEAAARTPGTGTGTGSAAAGTVAQPGWQRRAARDLRLLCEVLLTQPGALESLADSLPGTALPDTPGARALGGVLHLAECEDSARFWWQYAAGAGDAVSSYCLHLHHRAAGEDEEAEWWLDHTTVTPATATFSERTTRREIATALRVLRSLRKRPPLSEALRALVEYVPAAVGFVDDDLELPLPGGDLADLVEALTPRDEPRPRRPAGTRRDRLPARRPPAPAGPAGARGGGGASIQDTDIQDALRDCEEAATSPRC
ncbi:hypothetical protein [Streptomyces sp. MAR4 CNX-425]|uniref:hypothetical protein n=1 Tax=Streptomyces sp. MAR4 CNX-425 TaxID=3406343 RepID=UPI003B500164